METFISKRKLFQVDLPENWRNEFDGNVYTFQQDESSALQISAMFHSGGKQFILQEELEKVQKEHPTAQITQLSEYESIHYGLDLVNDKMLQYHWITGYKNVKLLCTLTISSELENEKLDKDYEKSVAILDTLKIFPPEI
jgi:L-rhamnose isomerase